MFRGVKPLLSAIATVLLLAGVATAGAASSPPEGMASASAKQGKRIYRQKHDRQVAPPANGSGG